MSELTLMLLKGGFLILLWAFVFAVVYALRADLFGVRARKMPAEAAPAPAPNIARPPVSPSADTVQAPRVSNAPAGHGIANVNNVSRIIITSGPKQGLEIPLTGEPLTIGRSRESGLVIRDDYTSSHHARLILSGDEWMVQDLNSTNGTFHDGEKVTGAVPIKVGASVKVGATTFELRK